MSRAVSSCTDAAEARDRPQEDGKLLVATAPEEEAKLAAIFARAMATKPAPWRTSTRATSSGSNRACRRSAGLWSPESGIVDVHELHVQLPEGSRDHGAQLVFQTEVEGIDRSAHGFDLSTRTQRRARRRRLHHVVNSAGLFADRIAERAGLDIDALSYRYHWCKGDYFSLAPELRGLVRHLIYPAPVHAGLGIHITFDLGGKMTLGPDTEYVSELSYQVDPDKRGKFAAAARRYLPDLRDHQLSPDYAGIRPKLQGPNDEFRDFVIEDASPHGVPGLVNLLGIESPGVTASEAIAERASALIAPYFKL